MKKAKNQHANQKHIYKNVFSNYRHATFLTGWKRAYVERIFTDMPIKKGGDFLDIGTGSGFMPIEAAKRGMVAMGVDISEEGIKLCQRYSNIEFGRSAEKRIKFIVGEAEHLPFKINSFDRITSIALLEHIPDDNKVISEIARVAKKGCMISICVPNSYKNTPILLRPFIRRIDVNVGHLRHYDPQKLIKKFEKKGFVLLDLTYHGHFIIILNSLLNFLWSNPPGVLDNVWWWITRRDLARKNDPKSVNFTITMIRQ